ncbi:SusE domain-containing protein [Hymenobacter sp. BT635]|uniref:SusE domain-containing protein n=1 Tax=Hymenobacter nitidus TaxID=2880929 RepID=A0ABS8AFC5_9BACT|nr:SusE domain-containing protein [Hymenobacter nitidus]MCB2379106.1 SusE domain-containing protein [Hymenobacter nitidus]
MKSRFTQVVLGLFTLATFTLASCEKDEVRATVTPDGAPAFSASTSAVVLQQANSSDNAVTFTWSPIKSFTWSNAEKPYNLETKYTFQIDKKGNNFAAPVSVDAGAGPTTSLTVEKLNESLIMLGLAPNVAAPVEIRLKGSYSPSAQLYSPVVSMTATPYKVCVAPTSDVWGIVGSAAISWDTDAVMTYDCDSKTYKLTRTMGVGEFKFRANRAWTVNFGDDGADGTLEQDGKNINVTTAGVYTITLDLAAKKYTMVK